nr:DUF6445 family protein [Microbulbifer zhoushanensis]
MGHTRGPNNWWRPPATRHGCGLDTHNGLASPLLELVRPGYASECDEWYETVGEVAATFNRVAFYPASLLHSGVVEPGQQLPDHISNGRLTITGFINLAAPLSW